VLVYLLVRERAGTVLGLAAATLVVFLGTAWEDLLWSFQIGLIGSLATGLGMLLALERDTPRRNAIACCLLVLSIGLSDLGIPFLVAAAIAVALRRRPLQLWVPGVPAVLFAIWYLEYGRDAPSNVTADNVHGLPRYVVQAAASGLASITGRGGEKWLPWGYVLLVLVAAAIAVWLARAGRPGTRVLVFAGATLAFWVAAGANYIPGREPYASRYQLVSATLLLLTAAELFGPVRLSSTQTAGVLAAALVALGLNLDALAGGYGFMRARSADAKAYIGALEVTRGHSAAAFQIFDLAPHAPFLTGVTPGRYFEETARHGALPFYSPGQIADAPPARRELADHVLVATYDVRLEPARRPGARGGCRRSRAEVELPVGGALIANPGDRALDVDVRRFAPASLPVSLGPLGAGRAARLVIPRDRLALPWHLLAGGGSTLEVCRL
jgi:hypothetical protein